MSPRRSPARFFSRFARIIALPILLIAAFDVSGAIAAAQLAKAPDPVPSAKKVAATLSKSQRSSAAEAMAMPPSGGALKAPTDPYILTGLNFSPYENGQDPNISPYISPQQIQARLQSIAPYTQWIHSYSMTTGLEKIPPIAKSMGLKVAAGAWISSNLAQNDTEIANLIAAANAGNVDIAVVGNEAVSLQGVTASQLVGYMNEVRASIPAGIPVTTAEIYGTLLANQSLIDASDQILVNIYPFWEGRPFASSVCFLASAYNQVRSAVGNKTVVISEAGWPSGGGEPTGTWASPANSGQYFLQFISWARANNVPYFYFEAYDEAWKADYGEGRPGAYWGIWDQYGLMKPLMQTVFDGNTVPVDCVPGGPGTPQISFTYVPPYGDAIDSNVLEGQVQHVLPWQYAVAVYIQVGGGWWTKPTFAAPVTPLQGDGSWLANINTGGTDIDATAIAGFLIPISYSPPSLSGSPSLPQALYDNSVANLIVPRSTNSISGQVLATAATVNGVTITLSGAENQVTTSGRLFGEYSFYNLSSTGPYTITSSGLGLSYDAAKTFSSVTSLLRAVDPEASPVSNPPPGVTVEAPSNGASVSGTILVKGWALDNLTSPGTNLGGVDVQVDGSSLGNATYGWFRPDICGSYPGWPDCPNAGFAYLVDTSKLSVGQHTVSVCATDTDLLQTDTGCANLNISVFPPPYLNPSTLAFGNEGVGVTSAPQDGDLV